MSTEDSFVQSVKEHPNGSELAKVDKEDKSLVSKVVSTVLSKGADRVLDVKFSIKLPSHKKWYTLQFVGLKGNVRIGTIINTIQHMDPYNLVKEVYFNPERASLMFEIGKSTIGVNALLKRVAESSKYKSVSDPKKRRSEF